MKISHLLSAALLVLITCSLIAAQRRTAAPTSKPPAAAPQTAPAAAPGEVRIGLIDTSAFGDEKEGIFRFREAVRSVELELQPKQTELENLGKRFETLAKEINDLSKASVVSQESITAKKDEADRVSREMREKKESAQKLFERRYEEVAGPVSRDIGNALTKFAEQRGITLTLDVSKLLPAILTMAPTVDLTKEFVTEYNSKNPASPAPPTQ